MFAIQVYNIWKTSNNFDEFAAATKSTITSTSHTIRTTYGNPEIYEKNCSLTVVLFDPNIDKHALWTLESVADNIYPKETTCYLLQTSICQIQAFIKLPYEQALETKARIIQDAAKPNFLSAIKKGNVRMSVIDHNKYSLDSCDDFYSPSNVSLHIDYWGDLEFTEYDSDTILMVQSDGIICHPLHINC